MDCKIVLLGFLALTCSLAVAFDNAQDFCVADPNTPVRVNGFPCKDPNQVEAKDFFHGGLHLAGNTSNPTGGKVTSVNVAQIPGLNTLGISMVRIDYAPGGLNPPHSHPRASEILTVVKGVLEVGFVTSAPDFRLMTAVLRKGDVFVFPAGLIHYQRNVGRRNAVAIGGLNSQNPGVITVANAVFGSNPAISGDVLAKAFQIERSVVDQVREKFRQ